MSVTEDAAALWNWLAPGQTTSVLRVAASLGWDPDRARPALDKLLAEHRLTEVGQSMYRRPERWTDDR
jgi:hypothetical protein